MFDTRGLFNRIHQNRQTARIGGDNRNSLECAADPQVCRTEVMPMRAPIAARLSAKQA
jgi:hypothetical protein